MNENLVEKKRIYTGKLLKFNADRIKTESGKHTLREWVSHPGASAAIPFLDKHRILLVRQYRYAVKDYLLEIPAGTIEEGEEPEETIKRELEEETGYCAGKIEKINSFFPSPGYTDETIYLYKATDLTPSDKEKEKNIQLSEISIDEIQELINRGEIRDGKTIIAVLSLLL